MTHTSTEQEHAEFEAWAIANDKYHVSGYNPHSDLWEAWQAARRAPAEPVISEAQVLAITTAYEQGVGKGHQSHARKEAITNPYGGEWGCDSAWQMGYDEGREQAERKATVLQWDGVVKPADFIVSTFRREGSGWVPKPDNCVRITHRPTGFFEEENAMRSVHANKAVAWQRLSDRLESLAAAPQPPAAAPVQIPEPAAKVVASNCFREKSECINSALPVGAKLYTEQQVRAMLAEVSAPAAPQAVLGWVHELKNGKLGSKFYTYEPHCDNAVRDDGGKKIAVAAHDPLYTAPQAQGVGAQLVAFIEKVRDFTAQAVRVGSKEGEIRWDIEFGHYDIEVRGKTLQEAIAKAIAAQAKQERRKEGRKEIMNTQAIDTAKSVHVFINKDDDEIPLLVAVLKALLQQETTTSTNTDAKDAARYRWLRDNDWNADKELGPVIRLQLNAIWDVSIDKAMETRAKQGEQS